MGVNVGNASAGKCAITLDGDIIVVKFTGQPEFKAINVITRINVIIKHEEPTEDHLADMTFQPAIHSSIFDPHSFS
jgi:hypothetical protein